MVLKSTLSVFIVTVIVLLGSLTIQAQINNTGFSIEALRVQNDTELTIDGSLSESIWLRAPVATGFTQSQPFDGKPASETTEVRVLYSDKYLFVGFKAYDSSPDSIVTSLFRRDGSEASDWVYVSIDSYNDKRTAFTFAANPLGVQKDIMYFNDSQEDVLWNAVWEVQSRIVEDGWECEFKIPLSQLRFTSSETNQNWGINFQRRIARRGEISFWSRTPRQEYGVVSRFGKLEGVKDLARPMRLEVMPYISGQVINDQRDISGHPFLETNDFSYKVGGDIKYGITSDFTLTATINPDFGQVEADPAVFNLSEYENYFEERRPFFLEGNDIFNFGGTTSQNTFKNHQNFYSRRIGKTPYATQNSVTFTDQNMSVSPDYVSRNPVTTIAGAAKVSGKTKKGFSLGVLNSYTLEETASYLDIDEGVEGKFTTEPATNYFVGRVRQDLQKTDAQIGGYVSSVNRMLKGSYLENYLHESAYQAGVDAQYYWNSRNWGASGVLSMSSVQGTPNALRRTQQTSAHFYNRSDSKGLSLDTTRTSLSGYFGEFSIGKYGGRGLNYSFTYSEMSPGYDVNDIGYMERADYRAPHFYAEYLNVQTRRVQFYWLWADASYAWNFDGDMIFNYYSTGAYIRLNNLWTLLGTFGFTGRFYNDRIARGGPTMLRPKDWRTQLQVTSNDAKNIYANITAAYRRDAAGEYDWSLGAGINARPTTFVKLSLTPTFRRYKDLDQYQGFLGFNAENEATVLFSNIEVDMFYADFRADITFSPTISLQTFVRPFFYTADFTNYKTFSESKTFQFEPYEDNEEYETLGQFYDLNFDLMSQTLQGNAVLRWEYKPGSTLFLVWQQSRSTPNSELYGAAKFDFVDDFKQSFQHKPVNIFLIKLSYWFGS